MSADQVPTWDVAVLGPSRVGKTSLLTALRVAADDYFGGTPVSVKPENAVTRRAFADKNALLLGVLAARRFSPDALPGDEEIRHYGLTVNGSVNAPFVVLKFHDHPGGWLLTEKHEAVRELLAVSPTVIVPIDATLLMEAGEQHAPSMVRGLALHHVEEEVREWAKNRAQNGDPTSLLLVPVKCESYFNDNGGRYNEADKLFQRVRQHYGRIVDVYRKESKGGPVLYAPVDTIGPIQLMDVSWTKEATGEHMTPEYTVRSDAQGRPLPRTIKGAEPILAHLVRDVLSLQEETLRVLEAEAQQDLDHLHIERARQRSNWFKRILDDWSGRNESREASLAEARRRAGTVDDSIRTLARSVESLAGDSARVRPWA